MNFNVKFKEEAPSFNVKFGWNNGEFEAGKAEGAKEEYDRFWDVYQDNGNRTNYESAFCKAGWNNETFKPKYSMTVGNPPGNYNMFGHSQITGSLTEILGNLGITLIFNGGYSSSTFNSSLFSEINIKDSVGFTTYSYTFNGCENLEELSLAPFTVNTVFANTFNYCYALKNLNISGTIGGNGFNVGWSTKLSKASIVSIINALSDTAEGQTITFSQTAKQAAFTDSEWAALIGTKPNWTIALA